MEDKEWTDLDSEASLRAVENMESECYLVIEVAHATDLITKCGEWFQSLICLRRNLAQKHHCHDKFTLKCTESWIKSQLNLSMTVCQCKRNSKNCTTRRTLSWQCTHWNRFGIAKLHLQLWPIAIKRELRLPRFCQHMPFRMQRTIILCSHKPSS